MLLLLLLSSAGSAAAASANDDDACADYDADTGFAATAILMFRAIMLTGS